MATARAAQLDHLLGVQSPEHYEVLIKVHDSLEVPERLDRKEDGPLTLVQSMDAQTAGATICREWHLSGRQTHILGGVAKTEAAYTEPRDFVAPLSTMQCPLLMASVVEGSSVALVMRLASSL